MEHDQIIQLNPVIHAPVRLAVLSVLMTVEEAGFKYLKKVTQTTDGNLSTHLSKLETGGFIKIIKQFKAKKPQTTCSITDKGRKAFIQYIEQMEQIIEKQKKNL
ncbi:transcriptional regulator [candidate division KSB1 bacterium]|nr:transcriptional regulator [candidate division KSB1 bacterium]